MHYSSWFAFFFSPSSPSLPLSPSSFLPLSLLLSLSSLFSLFLLLSHHQYNIDGISFATGGADGYVLLWTDSREVNRRTNRSLNTTNRSLNTNLHNNYQIITIPPFFSNPFLSLSPLLFPFFSSSLSFFFYLVMPQNHFLIII